MATFADIDEVLPRRSARCSAATPAGSYKADNRKLGPLHALDGVGKGDKWQSLVDLTEHPQCDCVENLRCDALILAEPVGEIGVARAWS